MKKLLLSLSVGVMAWSASVAQTSLPQPAKADNRKDVRMEKLRAPSYDRFKASNSNSRANTRSMWYGFVQSLDAVLGQGTMQPLALTIYRDSTVQNVSADQQGNISTFWNTWVAVGAGFDPKASIAFGDSALSLYNPYYLDSVAFFYAYDRRVDSVLDTVTNTMQEVVDTLIVQWNVMGNGDMYSWNGSGEKFGTVGYIRKTGKANTPATYTETILLHKADTAVQQYSIRSVYTKHMKVNAGANCVATLIYRSGIKNNFGDTLSYPTDGTVTEPKHKLNLFRVRTWYDASQFVLDNYNNGLLLDKQQAAGPDRLANFGTKFLPSSYYLNRLYPEFLFYVKDATKVGIQKDQMVNGYGVSDVYPNPANGSNANLEVALGNAENLTIQVTNVMGQTVSTVASGMYVSGSHKFNLATEAMKPGIYFANVKAGEFVKTVKFTVAR